MFVFAKVCFFTAGPSQGKKAPLGGSKPKAQRGGFFYRRAVNTTYNLQ